MSTFTINQKNNYVFSIELPTDQKNEILLKSLLGSKILGAGTTINSDFTKICLNASCVFSLTELLQKYKRERKIGKLDYRETENLVRSLSSQIQCLERSGYTFYNFSLDSILVVFKNRLPTFVCLDVNYLMKISGGLLKFNHMFDLREKFLCSEIKRLRVLPSTASSKCIYYSLACLALFCIFEDFDEDIESENKRKLKQIEFTPLYFQLFQLL